jgi:nucleoside-diphosphate-sugar epimerase
MKVLVTGASGYIGGSVATALLAAGRRVVGLVRSNERAAEVHERGIEVALDRAPPGAFYYAANGENSMREACQAIGRMLGLGARTEPMAPEAAAAAWGEGAASYTMGSNSRVRAVRARRELGWAPHRPALLEDIEHGSYRET